MITGVFRLTIRNAPVLTLGQEAHSALRKHGCLSNRAPAERNHVAEAARFAQAAEQKCRNPSVFAKERGCIMAELYYNK